MNTDKMEWREDESDWSALAMALAPVAPSADLAQRLKSRILAAAASEPRQPGLRTIRKEEVDWQPFSPLVEMKLLRQAGGSTTALFRMQAGAQLPLHSHGDDEECFIVEGEIFLGGQHLQAGDYQLAGEGSAHVNCYTNSGCIMLVRAPTASFGAMSAETGRAGA